MIDTNKSGVFCISWATGPLLCIQALTTVIASLQPKGAPPSSELCVWHLVFLSDWKKGQLDINGPPLHIPALNYLTSDSSLVLQETF